MRVCVCVERVFGRQLELELKEALGINYIAISYITRAAYMQKMVREQLKFLCTILYNFILI